MNDREMIEEMAKVMCGGCHNGKECMRCLCADWYRAEMLYNARCRILKANEIVREINESDQASWIEGYKAGYKDGIKALQLQTKEKIDEITTKLIEE